MLIHCTQRACERLKITPPVIDVEYNPMYSWRLNIVEEGRRLVVFMNDANPADIQPDNSAASQNNQGGQSEVTEGETQSKQYDNSMEAAQIMELMTLNDACDVVIDCGMFKGKTLGSFVEDEKPEKLKWYFTSYTGKNNILRAGAKILWDYVEKVMQNSANTAA